MANFSGAVMLADLNDFIAPSQACVVNLNTGNKAQLEMQDDFGQVQLQPKNGKGFSQTKSTDQGAVRVTLHDCLACSGCVTSAEAVLLEHQSTGELMERLKQPGTTVIVSISPQTRASLAAYHGLTPLLAFRKLTHFLKGLGVAYVLDTSHSRDLSLLEAAAEFVHRYRLAHPNAVHLASEAPNMDVDGPHPANGRDGCSNGAAAPPSPPTPDQQPYTTTKSNGHSNASTTALHSGTASGAAAGLSGSDTSPSLPMLASACPGWVCYAEKTHGEYVLPYISTAKSPQAVMGSLVKRRLCPRLGLNPQKVYHCSVMPCYDKKLEAARDDFLIPGTDVAEVDSVLTSIELQQLLEAEGIASLADVPEASLDTVLSSDTSLHGVPGGSGGYLEFIFRTAARELFGRELPPGPLPLRTLRNADFKEVSLEVDGAPVLRFAAAYGFRNIQTVVRKLKRRVTDYDFVEVMACPSGCLNGGGQIKPANGQSAHQLIEQLEVLYHHAEVEQRHPGASPAVAELYQDWVGGPPGSEPARWLLHTGYHKRDKTITASLGDW